MPQWTCKPEVPEEGLTVGQRYKVQCEGNSVDWVDNNLIAVIPEPSKFNVKILKFVDINNDKVSFEAVAYKAGDLSADGVVIKDRSENQVELSAWSVKVETVLEGEPKPYGPFGPFGLDWPIWFWLLIGTLLLTLVGTLISIHIRRKRREEWAEIVGQYVTSLSAYHQFYKDTRKILRVQEDERLRLKKLEESFRLYFLRELEVPTLNEDPRWIFSILKKKNPQGINVIKKDFAEIFRELRVARRAKQKVTAQDTEQLTLQCQKVVDKVNDVLRSEK